MLPDTNDSPARCLEEGVRLFVPLHIALKLGYPVVRIGGGHGPVMGAAMPEAPVHEDGDLGGPEHNVGSTTDLLDRPDIHPIPEPHGVQ